MGGARGEQEEEQEQEQDSIQCHFVVMFKIWFKHFKLDYAVGKFLWPKRRNCNIVCVCLSLPSPLSLRVCVMP